MTANEPSGTLTPDRRVHQDRARACSTFAPTAPPRKLPLLAGSFPSLAFSPSRRGSGQADTASPRKGHSNAAEGSDGLCCRREPQSLCGALIGAGRWPFGEALKRPGEVLGITGAKKPDPGLACQSVRQVLIMIGHDEGHAVSGRVEDCPDLLGPPWSTSDESTITGSVDLAKFTLGDRARQIHHSPTAARCRWFQLRRPGWDTADDKRYWSSEELESPLYRLYVPVRPPSANHCHHEFGVGDAEFVAGRAAFIIAYVHGRIGDSE